MAKETPHAKALKLFATPKPMLKWLRSVSPRKIVCGDLLSNTDCLGARFLKAHGFKVNDGQIGTDEVDVTEYFWTGTDRWFGRVVNAMSLDRKSTAAAAIKVIEQVLSERGCGKSRTI